MSTNSRRSGEGSGLPSFGRIPGWSARSSARRGPGPPDLKLLNLVPGRDILCLGGEGLLRSPRPAISGRAQKGNSYKT